MVFLLLVCLQFLNLNDKCRYCSLNSNFPYKNLEHALHTLYTQFAFMLHSFCALVNHILHMCKMFVVSKILGTCAKCAQEVYIRNMCAVCAQSSRYGQNMRSLHTIFKICAKYAQFTHKKERKSTAPVAGHPSKYWAG